MAHAPLKQAVLLMKCPIGRKQSARQRASFKDSMQVMPAAAAAIRQVRALRALRAWCGHGAHDTAASDWSSRLLVWRPDGMAAFAQNRAVERPKKAIQKKKSTLWGGQDSVGVPFR